VLFERLLSREEVIFEIIIFQIILADFYRIQPGFEPAGFVPDLCSDRGVEYPLLAVEVGDSNCWVFPEFVDRYLVHEELLAGGAQESAGPSGG
jgi:hypothetical protein